MTVFLFDYQVILKEREERKQRRLMEERGETAEEPEEGSDEGEESVTNNTGKHIDNNNISC